MSPRTISFPFARTIAIAALMGSTFLVSPLAPARADPAIAAPVQLAQTAPTKTPATVDTTSNKIETLEQRIANLHGSLKITPDEELKWSDVAQAMRENSYKMEQLVTAKRAQSPQDMTALDDLMTYQTFAQAHVDGLKNLTASFATLYNAMPAAQKKNADLVFQGFGHKGAPSHG
jgi:periplasmic protein CpxP/Spy